MKKLLALVMATFLLAGCGQTEEQIEAKNADCKNKILFPSKEAHKKDYTVPEDTQIKSSGNSIARKFGTTGKVELPKGQKLLMVTYKGDTMWFLYRPMREGEHAESYVFQEDSAFGVMEGTVRIREVE